jgi:colanic acid biosynthesis glycosyl transferase WcaI
MSQAFECLPSTEEPAGGGPERIPRRVLIVALNYAPDLVGCAKYTTELAEDLVARGHAVEVVTAAPYYPAWRVSKSYKGWWWASERLSGVRVHRTPLYVPSHPVGIKRIAHLASFGAAALPTAVGVALRFKPDVVFTVAPTLAAAAAGWMAARVSGAHSWLHVQDFEVDTAFDLGILQGLGARRLALGFERRMLPAFDRVSTISPAMMRRLVEKGVTPDRVLELRNWVDLETTQVFASSNTTIRRDLGIAPDQIVCLYSGNMAAKQGIESLAQVARLLKAAEAPITVVLCGDGPARRQLEQACGELDNVRMLPLQPVGVMPELLGTADIHLLPQKPEAADLVLPSKLTGMLASGRPVIAMTAPGQGLAAEIEGCGIAVEASAEAMAQAVLTLATDPAARITLGAAARLRAEKRWGRRAIIDRFEEHLAALCDQSPRSRRPAP